MNKGSRHAWAQLLGTQLLFLVMSLGGYLLVTHGFSYVVPIANNLVGNISFWIITALLLYTSMKLRAVPVAPNVRAATIGLTAVGASVVVAVVAYGVSAILVDAFSLVSETVLTILCASAVSTLGYLLLFRGDDCATSSGLGTNSKSTDSNQNYQISSERNLRITAIEQNPYRPPICEASEGPGEKMGRGAPG